MFRLYNGVLVVFQDIERERREIEADWVSFFEFLSLLETELFG